MSNTGFAATLRNLRKSRGWTQDELAERLNTSKQVISRYERGERSPKVTDAKRIADVFGVSLSELDGGAVITPSTVKPFHTLQKTQIPLIGEVAAGEPIVTNQEYEVSLDGPVNADYALRIRGESMLPTYQNGDVIYIRKQDNIDYDGQVAVVILDDEATVKHVYRQTDGLLLVSDNPSYAPMFKRFEDYSNIRILGKVCGYTRMYED